VLRARAIGDELNAGETEHKANDLILKERADNQAAIVRCGDEHVRRDNIRFTARPYGTLQFFDGCHVFGGFK
jgi:hypothetical protein